MKSLLSHLLSRLRYVLTASAVATIGMAGGAYGAHTAAVEAALAEARDAARDVESKRDGLVASLDIARTVAGDADAHLTEAQVSAALAVLDSTVADAASTAESLNVTIELVDTTATPPFLNAAAEDLVSVTSEQAPSASETIEVNGATAVADATEVTADGASADPSPSPEESDADETTGLAELAAPPAATTAETLASLTATPAADAAEGDEDTETTPIADSEVQRVLEREERDLDAVRAATEELLAAAEALDQAAAEVNRVADEVSDVTAQAALESAVLELDEGLALAVEGVEETGTLLDAVGDHVADATTVKRAAAARKGLQVLAEAQVDREDVEAVNDYLLNVGAARRALDAAIDEVEVSHTAWVTSENVRITAENEALTAEYEAAVKAAQEEITAAYRAAVSSHQNGWSGAPPGVTYSNGRVPSSELCSISFAPGHKLQCDAAEALELANAAYKAQTGRNLSFTDSYRSYASQVATRAAKPSTAAVPGTSNHGWGMAVDFDYASAKWMAANGADFGWVHPLWARSTGSKPEWWHLEFVAPNVGSASLPDEPELTSKVKNVFTS